MNAMNYVLTKMAFILSNIIKAIGIGIDIIPCECNRYMQLLTKKGLVSTQ